MSKFDAKKQVEAVGSQIDPIKLRQVAATCSETARAIESLVRKLRMANASPALIKQLQDAQDACDGESDLILTIEV